MDDISSLVLQGYLDTSIRNWRSKLKHSIDRKSEGAMFPAMESTDALMARCYIDAFQSVRISMLGELLPEDE